MFKVCLYEGAIKELVKQTKYSASRAGASELGDIILKRLPRYRYDLVTYVPTDPKSVRYRGFDHAKLMARQVAVGCGADMRTCLVRSKRVRQVGATRSMRKKQMNTAFITNATEVAGKNILLVDDVVSTASTIEAAASVLKKAGAQRVTVAVAAHNR